jgi:hypothetical protein
MQHTQFRAKSAKNDLKPPDFLKRNFYFETEGVCPLPSWLPFPIPSFVDEQVWKRWDCNATGCWVCYSVISPWDSFSWDIGFVSNEEFVSLVLDNTTQLPRALSYFVGEQPSPLFSFLNACVLTEYYYEDILETHHVISCFASDPPPPLFGFPLILR